MGKWRKGANNLASFFIARKERKWEEDVTERGLYISGATIVGADHILMPRITGIMFMGKQRAK